MTGDENGDACVSDAPLLTVGRRLRPTRSLVIVVAILLVVATINMSLVAVNEFVVDDEAIVVVSGRCFDASNDVDCFFDRVRGFDLCTSVVVCDVGLQRRRLRLVEDTLLCRRSLPLSSSSH